MAHLYNNCMQAVRRQLYCIPCCWPRGWPNEGLYCLHLAAQSHRHLAMEGSQTAENIQLPLHLDHLRYIWDRPLAFATFGLCYLLE
jgi:hypothetical protein